MPKTSRKLSQVNASSMADIAFLLLVFFLVTTSIETDWGILRKLPPAEEDPHSKPFHERNILEVFLNANNDMMVEGKQMTLSELRNFTKSFLLNAERRSDWPAFKTEEIPVLGNMDVSKGIVSVQSDRSTNYATYLGVQNELIAAYRELRDAAAQKYFGTNYEDLVESGQQEKVLAIRKLYPQRISEAEPVNKGGLNR